MICTFEPGLYLGNDSVRVKLRCTVGFVRVREDHSVKICVADGVFIEIYHTCTASGAFSGTLKDNATIPYAYRYCS